MIKKTIKNNRYYILLLSAIKYYFPFLPSTYGRLKKFFGKEKSIEKANARYCYSVYLRHLKILSEYNLDMSQSVVAELGPGDSIGMGLMSLITGSKKYYALDVHQYTNLEQNILLLEELKNLLMTKADIPDDQELPRVYPRLKNYSFPSKILTDEIITNNLASDRINIIIENLLNNTNISNKLINYYCPWYDSRIISKESVDVIYSQAVLEHVNKLDYTYGAMHKWLKKGGVMSHQIDFKSHGTSVEWNGHWKYSDYEWKLIGGAPDSYSINRAPLSKHLELLKTYGFKIIAVITNDEYPYGKYRGSISQNQLSRSFKDISEEDFKTCNAHIISVKE